MIPKKIEIFTSLDLELNQAETGAKIIQIGAVVGNLLTGEILEKLSVFINPHEALTPYIIELTGIKQADVDAGVSLLEGYNQLKDLHKRHGSFINPIQWGHGDTTELHAQIKAENPEFKDWCFGRRCIDAKTMYVMHRIAQGKPPVGGLAKAMTKFGLAFKGRKHNATDDSLNTLIILSHMLKTIRVD